MAETNQDCPSYKKTLHQSSDFGELMLILWACCRHWMRILVSQCAGANPSIMPSTMKRTNAERMITGNKNLSIFIKDSPPGVLVMVLQHSLLV
jgi:hypothetical protein